MKKRYIFILFVIFLSCLFVGCKNDAIKIYHESRVSDMIQGLQKPKTPTVKRSSGIVIYKDASESSSQRANINFGPSDVDFSVKIK